MVMINCGHSAADYKVRGHPYLSIETIYDDLSPHFDIRRVEECVYDMRFEMEDPNVPEWNKANQGVFAWCIYLQHRPQKESHAHSEL